MKTPHSVSISLPTLSDTEAYHLVDTFYDILLIVDSYYSDQIHRYINQRNHNPPPSDPCPRCGQRRQEPDFDDPLPF